MVKLNTLQNKNIVTFIKRSQQGIEPHKATFYRDPNSRRNNLENTFMERPQDKDLQKFWKKRYYLFSKFDRGVLIDDESWYSVTPEPMAKHIAQRVTDLFGEGTSNVLDGFAGVGGNAIQFARKCGFCVASDMDP